MANAIEEFADIFGLRGFLDSLTGSSSPSTDTDATNQPIRVLVFGTTGVGKTSCCNIVTGDPNPHPVSDAPTGCTFDSSVYDAFDLNGRSCIVTDTIGLNENDAGTVPGGEALKKLIALLKNSREGYNLLIHVMKVPCRITNTDKSNYEFFYKVVAQSKIPVVLVATGSENVEPMSAWRNKVEASTNRTYAQIIEASGLHYKEIVCTCFLLDSTPRTNYGDLRDISRDDVRTAIQTHALPQPLKLYTTDKGFIRLLATGWNWVVETAGFKQWKVGINKKVVELLTAIGLKPKEAEEEAQKF